MQKWRIILMAGDPMQFRTVNLEPGDILFKEGEASRDLFIVKKGKLRVFKAESGVEIELASMGLGAIAGEMAAIDGGKRSATCSALEPTELTVVPVSEFKRIISAIPEWFQKIASILVQRLRDADAKIHGNTGANSAARVAWLLAHISYSPLAQGGIETGRRVSRQTLENELVDILQVQIADVSSTLADLHNQGLIELGIDYVGFKNIEKLEEIGQTIFK
jgi:CRP/FNR family transcriptional regulator